MATVVTGSRMLPPAAGTEDPFHDPLMIGIGIVAIIVAIAILALTGLFYWGVEHHIPAWSSQSFPPPVVY